jgi:hypothetical protein
VGNRHTFLQWFPSLSTICVGNRHTFLQWFPSLSTICQALAHVVVCFTRSSIFLSASTCRRAAFSGRRALSSIITRSWQLLFARDGFHQLHFPKLAFAPVLLWRDQGVKPYRCGRIVSERGHSVALLPGAISFRIGRWGIWVARPIIMLSESDPGDCGKRTNPFPVWPVS